MRIVVGTRGSKLALIQVGLVVATLKALVPDAEITTVRVETQGDRNPHVQLDHMENRGVFVKELEEALLGRRIDLAVHSLKDVPTEIPPGLVLAAVMERIDPRDVLVTRGERLSELPPGSRIGTGSLRRSVQLACLRPDIQAQSIRGNVDTRLRKVASSEFDGVILAAAALERLGWQDKVTEYLPLDAFLPAVGQAALVIEMRQDDSLRELVSQMNHVPTWQSVTAERSFLYALGGGCRAPIAALGMVSGESLKLEGMVASVRQNKILRAAIEGSVVEANGLGKRLVDRLLEMGAADFIAEAERI